MADMQIALWQRLAANIGVSSIAGDRLFWVKVPQDTERPYIRLQTVSDLRGQHLKDYDGARVTRVQADCFSPTYAAARALAEAVIAAVAQPATVAGITFGRTKAEGPQDLGEDTANGFIHRASLDLLVEHRIA